jgi:NAD(P)-dependent dehydrogenase (short-subunit alcohol dehydrogenase family)
MTKSAIIIGASRGLGLGLAQEFSGRGWHVVATARGPAPELEAAAAASDGRITIQTVDIDHKDSVAALDSALGDARFDLVFVNAGTYGPRHGSTDEVTPDEIAGLMVTNAIAPIRTARTLLPRVADGGTIALMTSILGSVALNTHGTMDLYRASKASLNTISRGFWANDVKDRAITLLNLHPGWVKTAMGGDGADIDVATSVAGLADVVETHHGKAHRYLDYTGKELAW